MAAAAACTIVDHYIVLGLPSDDEGARLSLQEITKAYRSKARELHPDKNRGNPNYAHTNFLNLQISYEVLKDEKKRRSFDHDLCARREKEKIEKKIHSRLRGDSKRQKLMSDLEEREKRSGEARVHRDYEDEISRKIKEEIATIVAIHNAKKNMSKTKRDTAASRKEDCDCMEGGGNIGLNNGNLNLKRKTNFGGYQAFEDLVLEKLKRASQTRMTSCS